MPPKCKLFFLTSLGSFQTWTTSQLHIFTSGNPSVTGEEDIISFRSGHFYGRAVPFIVFESKAGVFLHLEQQKSPQR